jgi:hypothetical protein
MTQQSDTTRARWRVYPVGVAGELVNAVINAILPFLAGLGAAFVLILACGLLAEEDLIGGPDLGDALDQLARAAMAPMLGLGLGLGVLSTVLFALREAVTSRAIARAAAEGAPRSAVPHPSQVDLVAAEWPFFGFIVACGFFAGLGLLVTVVAAVGANSSERYIVWWSLLATGVAASSLVLALVGRRPYRRRRLAIAAHWTTADEAAAWRHAASASAVEGAEPDVPAELQRRQRVAKRRTYQGIVCFALGFGLLQLWMFIAHPYRSMSDAGPRAEYGDGVEVLLGAGIWVFAALMAAAVVLTVVGFFAESAVERGEQQILREALENPAAARPPLVLRRKYAQRRPVTFAQGMALLAALGTTFGWAVYNLGTGGMEDVASLYGGADETFGGLVPQALVTLAGSAAVVVVAVVWNVAAAARGYELRNLVVERWPVKPAPRMVGPEGKKEPDPASIGPSLTPTQKVSRR